MSHGGNCSRALHEGDRLPWKSILAHCWWRRHDGYNMQHRRWPHKWAQWLMLLITCEARGEIWFGSQSRLGKDREVLSVAFYTSHTNVYMPQTSYYLVFYLLRQNCIYCQCHYFILLPQSIMYIFGWLSQNGELQLIINL